MKEASHGRMIPNSMVTPSSEATFSTLYFLLSTLSPKAPLTATKAILKYGEVGTFGTMPG